MTLDLGGGWKETHLCADLHDAIIPFHEFVDQNERVFELINGLARQNIYHRPIFVDDDTVSTDGRPFALLEDWKEANRGTNIDIKSITADYLASKVREYIQIHPGKIMSSSFQGKREPISVKELISRYYEHPLGNHQLGLRPHLLDWLKEKMEERLDSCEYAMWYAKKDDKEVLEVIRENFLKHREDPDNKGIVKLLTEDISATKYLLKKIDRSDTIPDQNPVRIRDGSKVLLLDDFHLKWLKDFLMGATRKQIYM